ncbi:FAD-dependent oxidoreductase [Actinoplanes nipponensis]|uniref:FAD-dependent oxidoreductase n=1 Tax=Actinoplanes nipponensis TaxID=135950 RepID=UPI0031E5A017
MADVIVVGGGIIGLTAATRLRERGAEVTVWSAQEPAETVSAVAAAAWYPTRTGPGERILAWAAASYDQFRRDAFDRVPGVLVRETRNLERSGATGEPWWAPAARGVRYHPAPAPWTREVRFRAPLVEMGEYLPWLRERLRTAGARVLRRRVDRLEEALVEAPVVVKRDRAGRRPAVRRPGRAPARGQIVLVANTGIYTSVCATRASPARTCTRAAATWCSAAPGRRATGTPRPTRRPATPSWNVAGPWCRTLAGAPIVGEKVGLRPVRRGGPRVEAEKWPGGDGGARVRARRRRHARCAGAARTRSPRAGL